MPIPTLDSVKLARVVELLLLGNAKILLAGHAGIGKSVILNAILKRINKKSIFDKENGEVGYSIRVVLNMLYITVLTIKYHSSLNITIY